MTRPLFSKKLTVTLDAPTHDLLTQYAHAARQPMTLVAAGILADFLQKRSEIGDGLPSKRGDKTPILHDLFEDMEAKLTATLNGQSEGLYGIQATTERLAVMLEKLALVVLLHAPEVAEKDKATVTTRGKMRMDKWLETVDGASIVRERN